MSQSLDNMAASSSAAAAAVDEYLQALPNEERQFVKQIRSVKQLTRRQHQAQLVDLLVRLPYPLLQWLESDSGISHYHAGKLIRAALERLLALWEHEQSGNTANSGSTDVEQRLINFFVNFPLTVLEAPSLHAQVMAALPRIVAQSDRACMALICRRETKLLDEVFNEWQKAANFMGSTISREYVLEQALQHKRHFVSVLCEQLKEPQNIADVAVRHNLLVLKLANEFSSANGTIADLGNVMRWLADFNVSHSPGDLMEVHRYFHADFQRICTILEFLQRFPEAAKQIGIRTLVSAGSVLQLLFQHNIAVGYEETRRVVETTHKWQQQMLVGARGVSHNLELETLTYYAALCTVLDVLLPAGTDEMSSSTTSSNTGGRQDGQYYATKMQQLHGLLRQIRNLDALCALIEDIFQLIFLRWEHLRAGYAGERGVGCAWGVNELNTSRSKSTRSSESSEAALSETPPNAATANATTTAPPPQGGGGQRVRHGFVCRGQALQCIFTQLRNFVTRKCHSEDYKHASERIRMRFQRIVDVIGEALWKYSVLEKIDDALSRSGRGTSTASVRSQQEQVQPQQQCLSIGGEELVRLVRMHNELAAKSSTDDDNGQDETRDRDRSNLRSLTRRRRVVKVRRRATFSGALHSPGGDEVAGEAAQAMASGSKSLIVPSGGNVGGGGVDDVVGGGDSVLSQERHKIHDFVLRFADRSIIPKMLGSPEKLAIMALALNNLDDVKYIIETFNLQNSELNRELSFVEQQQLVKHKLATIYTNYSEQEDAARIDGQRPKATVDQIKQVAAKGFEVSKIISVIDNFAKSQQVQQSAELRSLLQKHAANPLYANTLRQFEERNLNAILICDLILNMPFNREITANILVVIKRQQQMASGVVVGNRPANLADHEVAMQARLPRDIGSMHLLENVCECLRLLPHTTLQELMYDNFYTLRPRQLVVEQQREQAFAAVFYRSDAEVGRCADLKRFAPLFHGLKASSNYFTRFSAYVIQLARLLQLRDPNLVYHIGELLKIDPYTVIGELVFECEMTPLEIAANVSALNLNLVHVIALNMCPHIGSTTATAGTATGTTSERPPTNTDKPSLGILAKCSSTKLDTILNYVAHQNRLLAWLLQGILEHAAPLPESHNGAASSSSAAGLLTLPLPKPARAISVDRLRGMQSIFMERLVQLPELERWAALFEGNRFIAALLSDDVSVAVVRRHLPGAEHRMEQLALLLLQLGNRVGHETAACETDRLIAELIQANAKCVHLAAHVHDIGLRARLIYDNFTRIATTRLAKELIENTLQHRQAMARIPAELRRQLEATLADITIYAQVSAVLQFETWPQAYDFGQKTPSAIFQRLLQLGLYKLCYEWCCVVDLARRFAAQKRLFLENISAALLRLNDEDDVEIERQRAEQQSGGGNDTCCTTEENSYLLKILNTFTAADCVALLDAQKDRLRSVPLLEHVIEYLTKSQTTDAKATMAKYQNYRITLVIFRQLTIDERAHFWRLLRHPLLIVEQLIMNAKFELLAKVLRAVRTALKPATAAGSEAPATGICSFCFNKHGDIYNIQTKASSSSSSSGGGVADSAATAAQPKAPFQIGASETSRSATSAFMLLNFNLYQADHVITNECIDLLLRIYATKALDYHILTDGQSSSWEQISQSTDMQQSLDSLCDAFQMPRVAPSRDDWVRDEEATHCMCCRRAKFTMLMRRHHCRRCGRVVCYACSTHRMRIPEYYAEVEVRACNDCQRNTAGDGGGGEDGAGPGRLPGSFGEEGGSSMAASTVGRQLAERRRKERAALASRELQLKWQLSGNITHDKLVREEFCYEHAPSVGLCLSILGCHRSQSKCIDLLLYHCRQLEKLLVPNPEVDYELVAKMMNCLAVAAKVRGGPDYIDTIRVHSEIIISVVQYGCEALIPPGPLTHSLRKLADALVQAEKWPLALEVHLKYGFPTTSVMAAHGLACLRAGCYTMAREKLSHCMTRVSTELTNAHLLKHLLSAAAAVDTSGTEAAAAMPLVKRPQRAPPLLQEILRLIEATPFARPQPETLQRASVIRQSHTSLVSLLSRSRKETHFRPLHEPALHVVAALANLKRIARGQYGDAATVGATAGPANSGVGGGGGGEHADNRRPAVTQTRGFDECMHYLLSYGSHADILQFLVQQNQVGAALRYVAIQQLDAEHFIQHIFMVALRSGRVPALIERMFNDFDARSQALWRQTLLATCRHLETHQLLHSLYQLQLLLKDPVRASMTCVRFYSMRCDNFQQLHANAEHLHNAHRHLQSELEMAQWESINMNADLEQTPTATRKRPAAASKGRRSSGGGGGGVEGPAGSFLMQMDARALNSHINTILLQLEVAKFLASCEVDQKASSDGGTTGTTTTALRTMTLLRQIRLDSSRFGLPTLFDGATEKVQICILLLMCGKNIEQGYGLAYRVIEAYKVSAMKVFSATAKYLARNHRLPEVEKLLNCIRSNGDAAVRTSEFDELLTIAINAATNNHEPEVKTTLDALVKRIHSVEQRIASHIFIGQLKSAYLLANKFERLNDIRKIQRQAEASNQIHIKKLCEKKLSMSSGATTDAGGSSNSNSALLRPAGSPMDMPAVGGSGASSSSISRSQSNSVSSSTHSNSSSTGRGRH